MNKASSMPSTRLGGAFKLLMLFALQIGFIVVLHFLGSLNNMAVDFAHFQEWINTTPAEVALVASIRLLALGFSYWLVATSFLYMAARAFNIPFLIRALELTTIPGVRRVIDAGLAAAIIGGTVFGGAGAVFAKSSHEAQTQAAAAAVTSTYKDSRVLYNPEPAGDVVSQGPGATNTNQTVSVTPAQDVSVTPSKSQTPSRGKVVVAPTESAKTTVTPGDKDDKGNYIPTPAGGGGTETENTNQTDPSSTSTTPPTSNPKVVIDPTPADPPESSSTSTTTPSTTSTTTPKVTVPTTTPPIVTPPTTVPTEVLGQQVQRPNETPTQTSTNNVSYTVVSGDNFWTIAENQLRNSLGREPSESEVASYWVKVIETNKSTLRSGDPNLIFPGEVFTLPPV